MFVQPLAISVCPFISSIPASENFQALAFSQEVSFLNEICKASTRIEELDVISGCSCLDFIWGTMERGDLEKQNAVLDKKGH